MDKDISTLLGEIKTTSGWTESRIAEAIGTSQPTVHRILKGQSECKANTYRRILDLYRAVHPATGTRAGDIAHVAS